jgi:hypothetical protein
VDVLKVTVRKLVSAFGVLTFLVIDPEVPFCIFTKAVLAYKLIFLFGRRLIFAPRVSLVPHELTFLYELLGMVVALLI